MLLFLFAALAVTAEGATMYKWVDERGITHYSDNAPASQQKAQELREKPTSSDVIIKGAQPERKSWQEQEKEFQQRQEERKNAEAQEAARKKNESTEKQSNCKRAKDELSRLVATTPRIKLRGFVPLVDPDPETGNELETMNNAERSIRIKIAEEEIKRWCN